MMYKFGTYPIHVLLVGILWIALPHFEQTITTPTPTLAPHNSQLHEIAFTDDQNGTLEVSLINSDGSNMRNLTQVDSSAPSFSPDGRQIAFQSNRNGKWEIFLMNADGSDQHSLGEGASPAWSPDGKHIAFFTIDNGGARGISVMNPDGSNQNAITPGGSPTEAAFAWSPDGMYLCFTAPSDHGTQIYTVNSDGSSPHQITTLGENYWPTWSPDGKQIAFSTYGEGGIWRIYVMNADGSNKHQVSTSDIVDARYPSWSPDGKSIAFISVIATKSYIQIANTNSDQPILITLNTTINGSVVWSPNSEQIAFVGSSDGKSESIYVVNVDGDNQPDEVVDNVLGPYIEWVQ